MYKVVITDTVTPVAPEEAILREVGASLIYGDCHNENELIALTGDADAVINVYSLFPAKVINSLERCQIIVRRGIGFDTVDLKAATAKGIPVANIPDFCLDEVADHTMALLLSMARKIMPGRQQIKTGQWDYRQLLPIPPIKGATLGLLGFGKIPREVALRAKSFRLIVQATDPYVPLDIAQAHGVRLVTLNELLSTSDFISVHVNLTTETRNMLSTSQFSLMKPSAMVINTSRGPVIDEAALIEALKTGKIAGAALDVLTREPPLADNPLLKMENVIITPHIAWCSERSAVEIGLRGAAEIVRVFKGYFPKSLVNPEVIALRPNLKKE